MKLVFNLEDKLFWIHNFLPNAQYKKIHNGIFKERNILNYKSVKDEWDKDLIKNIGFPDKIDIDPSYFKFSETLMRHLPFISIKGKFTFTVHKMTKGSGINWHSDLGHKFGITYYVNKRWSRHWGGEFMFADKKCSGYIPVLGNSLLIIKTPLDHKVNPVLINHIPRFTIQTFVNEEN
jgi:Rps23 Pro-64 3,4-dihydroxylase Tpa1-like proline 4-hydroxylase